MPTQSTRSAASHVLTLLTATGARPKAWAVCERLMARQDHAGPVRWVIVDDGPQRQPVAFSKPQWSLEILRPQPFWEPGRNTQARNLAAGLAQIGPDARVVIIEDDDFYASDYLATVAQWLESADLVGEGGARYYNIASRTWHEFGNATHASLCSTALKGGALASLRTTIAADPTFIDMRLWRDFSGSKALHPQSRVVGIKGLPGRGGIGIGHRMSGQPDPDGSRLLAWLGEDAALYLDVATEPRAGVESFAGQFADHAIGVRPNRPSAVLRPIGLVGRNAEGNTPAINVYGSGLLVVGSRPYAVASIYGDNEQEAAHALVLGQKLEELGIRFFLAKSEGSASWREDGALRASYLHNLWKESGTPLVWLDIDQPVEPLREWFASLEADFAIRNRSLEMREKREGSQQELLTKAMWFGKTALAGELLAEWERRCQADSKVTDALHLAAAWYDITSRHPLRTAWLPADDSRKTSGVIQLLTPTGCRPETFALCARWMARQTYSGPVRWIIVDDGEVQQPLPVVRDNWELHVIRPQPFWREGDRTQPRNLLAGLDAALDAPVIVIEDDDWYAPDYLEVTVQRLEEFPMVAAGPQRWANVKLRTCGEYGALPWPWTSQLAFRPEAMAHVRQVAATRDSYIDRDIWNEWTGAKRLFRDGRVVGIKGLPGRGGYMSVHHRAEGQQDPGLQQLRQWIGADTATYEGAIGPEAGMANAQDRHRGTPGLVQLLTTTGCRPETFAICAQWMARQTYSGPVRWIIVDDGEQQQPLPAVRDNWELHVMRPEPFWREGDRTHARNFVAGLDAALDAPVIVIEDDDWYAPDYLEVTVQRLQEFSMVAVGPQRWANVRYRTLWEHGTPWPWTSQLAFQPQAIPHARSIASTREHFIDRDIWSGWTGTKKLFPDGRVVGIKGLPGRGGYMTSHATAQGRIDPQLRELQKWIGTDSHLYLRHGGNRWGELQPFVEQFAHQAVGAVPLSAPKTLSESKARPIGFVGRDLDRKREVFNVYGSGLLVVGSRPYAVASIYGDNEQEAAHALVLGQKLEELGIRFFLAKSEGSASWREDGALRASYLHNLWKESGTPLVWLDIDQPVEPLREWFASLEADFAIRNRSLEMREKREGSQQELLTKAMWFGKTALAGELLAEWERRCQADSKVTDALHLAAAWYDITSRHPLRTAWLPAEPAPPPSRPALPPKSVRGLVRRWIEKHADKLGEDVLEVGSRMHEPDAWWVINRDLARGQWTGIDMQPGLNVDRVVDIHAMPEEWLGRFSGILCSEVLEHVRRPWIALPNLRTVLRPGGWIVVTVPFCFPRHGFPSDYFRYTEEGLRGLLEDAGFTEIKTANSGRQIPFALNDHGEPGLIELTEPLHTYAIAQAPL